MANPESEALARRSQRRPFLESVSVYNPASPILTYSRPKSDINLITPYEVATDQADTGGWVTFDLSAVTELPRSALTLIFQTEMRMSGPDSDPSETQILYRPNSSYSDYMLSQMEASGNGDRIRSVVQTQFPFDRTNWSFDYQVTSPGCAHEANDYWRITLIGYR